MSKKDIFIDRFSAGLGDLTGKQQKNHESVLDVLRRTKMFSCFEASENPTIASTMTYLCRERLTTDNSCGYPWTKVTHIDGKLI